MTPNISMVKIEQDHYQYFSSNPLFAKYLKFENKYSLSVGAWHGRQGGQEGRRDDDGGEEGGGEVEVIDSEGSTKNCFFFLGKIPK